MGEEAKDEREAITSLPTLKFPFIPLPAHSPEHPLQTLASVPFKWEEQPGKPRPCTDIIPLPGPEPRPIRALEPPPCRMVLLMDPNSNVTKMPSPTTVLDGPKFSSFRLFRESFDSGGGGDISPHSSVDVLLGDKISNGGGQRRRGFFGRGGLRFRSGRKEGDEGSLGFSSPSPSLATGCERFKEEGKMRRNGSFSNRSLPSSPRLCATLYERLKQAVPWRSTRKSKKGLKVLEDV